MSLFTITVPASTCVVRYHQGALVGVLPAGRHRRRWGASDVPVDLRQFRSVVASALGRVPTPPRAAVTAVAAAVPAPPVAALQRLSGGSAVMGQVRELVTKVARGMAPVRSGQGMGCFWSSPRQLSLKLPMFTYRLPSGAKLSSLSIWAPSAGRLPASASGWGDWPSAGMAVRQILSASPI